MKGMTLPSSLSMTSTEISDLTGKQHKTVLRDIRVMLVQIHGLKDDSDLNHDGTDLSITIQKLPGINIEFFPVERATQRV